MGPKGEGERRGTDFEGRPRKYIYFGVELGIFSSPAVAYDWLAFPTEACDWSELSVMRTWTRILEMAPNAKRRRVSRQKYEKLITRLIKPHLG